MWRSGHIRVFLRNQSDGKHDPVSPAPFQHVPFEDASMQIRLLHLAPARDREAMIRCHLSVERFPLAESANYEALSYTWGDTDRVSTLDIRGQKLDVTCNLHAALQHLRDKKETRTLWVDAICINQANDEEKSLQIRLMHLIYIHAQRVVVWLGESDAAVRSGLDFLKEQDAKNKKSISKASSSKKAKEGNLAPGIDQERSRKRNNALSKKLDKLPAELQRSLGALYKRPWWSRVWVVQEVYFAQRYPLVGCGDIWFSFELALDVLSALLRFAYGTMEHAPKDDAAKRLPGIEDTESTNGKLFLLRKNDSNKGGMRLYFLLHATAVYEATDARDRVFALLNMVRSEHVSFSPDYAENSSTTYQQASYCVIKQEAEEGEILFLYDAVWGSSSNVPSWCVDFSQGGWTKVDRDLELRSLSRRRDLKYHDSSHTTPYVGHHLGDGSLHLRGMSFGAIRTAIPSSCGQYVFIKQSDVPIDDEDLERAKKQDYDNLLGEYGAFLHTAREAMETHLGAHTTETDIQAGELWRIIADGRDVGEGIRGWSSSRRESIYSLVQAHYRANIEQSLTNNDAQAIALLSAGADTVVQQALAEIARFARGSTLFTTHGGWLGRAAHPVQVGDYLVMLHGCQRPAILRRVHDGAYQLVTFTWTRGVMQGEAFSQMPIQQWREFSIV